MSTKKTKKAHRATKKAKLLTHAQRSKIQTKAAYKAWRTIRARAKAKAAKIVARTKARIAAKSAKKPVVSVPAVGVKVA